MKKILKFISLYGWKHEREKSEHTYNYLVVDMNTFGTYDGGRFGTRHYEAYKTDEFETEEQAKNYIENKVAKDDLRHIRLYKLVIPNTQ